MYLKISLIVCANTALKNFFPSIQVSDAELEFIASRSSNKNLFVFQMVFSIC